MFVDFLYELRKNNLSVSLTEWMTLMEALNKGLAFSDLMEFYYLARSILVKSETNFDDYDLAFHNYFSGLETTALAKQEILEWLLEGLPKEIQFLGNEDLDQEQIDAFNKLWQELAEQAEEQTPDSKEVSTAKTNQSSQFDGKGGGINRKGIRMGGIPGNFSAIKVAANREYKGYRDDMVLGVRKFEAALRVLRQLTNQYDGIKDELDIDGTIDETCRNGGHLKLAWKRPRENKLKILLVMDSGGSMDMHIGLCSQLFTACKRSSHLKDLKIYYFHNCIYEYLYEKPACIAANAVTTYDVLRELDANYRLILIGDASMAESELLTADGAIDWDHYNTEPGLVWMERLAKHFKHTAWLNPLPAGAWNEKTNYRAKSINLVRNLFPMYELSIRGLEQAVKQLKVNK